jgi:NADP-dependent 3-hydroxy acid dehydrogenase YdfG
MREAGEGSIVNIGSIHGKLTYPGFFCHTAQLNICQLLLV